MKSCCGGHQSDSWTLVQRLDLSCMGHLSAAPLPHHNFLPSAVLFSFLGSLTFPPSSKSFSGKWSLKGSSLQPASAWRNS